MPDAQRGDLSQIGHKMEGDILTEIDIFPDTFHAEFINQPLDYLMGGNSPPLVV